MKKLSGLLTGIFLALSLNAQVINQDRLDSLLLHFDQHQKAMGNISIFQDGKEIYNSTIGFADIEHHHLSNAETRYRIGSISKSFTATVILQLVDEGKVKLETKLSDYFPQLPNANKITIENLLRHQSGLFNFTNSPEYLKIMTRPVTREEQLATFIKNGIVFQAGEKTEYSNTNFELLAFIAEEIEHLPFAQILENRIIKPQGLSHTFSGGKIDPGRNEAISYTKLQKWTPAPETDMSQALGAGSVVSTAKDINLFFQMLFHGEVISSHSLIQMEKMNDNLGMGLMHYTYFGKEAFGHNGGIDGFQSRALYFPGEKLGVCYLTNAVDLNVNEILFGILSICFDKKYKFPVFQQEDDSISANFLQYCGLYSCPNFPLEVNISVLNQKLMVQATGQNAFPVDAYALHKFKSDAAGLILEFSPDWGKMTLRQGGGVFQFTRKK